MGTTPSSALGVYLRLGVRLERQRYLEHGMRVPFSTLHLAVVSLNVNM